MDPSDNNLSIDTPEQIALEFSVAGIGSRLLAITIDTLIQIAFYFLIILGLVTLAMPLFRSAPVNTASPNAALWAAAITVFLFFCIYWGYFAAFEVLWKGRTPGKYFMKIRVIKDNGRAINVYEGIGRNLMRVIDTLPTLYGVGLVTMAITKKNQRLGDLLAGTIVVHERAHGAVTPVWESDHTQDSMVAHVPVNAPQLRKLDYRDLQLIEAFLHRREQLQGITRINAADQIVAHIQAKGEIAPEPGEGPETFLERIARSLRDTAALSRER